MVEPFLNFVTKNIYQETKSLCGRENEKENLQIRKFSSVQYPGRDLNPHALASSRF